MKIKTLSALVALVVFASTAYSMTVGKEQFTCPIDGAEFEDCVNYSGTSFGMRLDLKPIGPTPAPWALPICLKCRFPLYKKDFEPDEIERYKTLIKSEKYKTIDKDAPPYFLLGKVNEFDKKPEAVIAYSYLQASWQVEDNKKKYQEYLEIALTHYEKAFVDSKDEDEDSLTSGILVAELNRQLGNFKKAIEQAELLKERKTDNETITTVLNQILKLSKQSSSEPQQIE